MTQEERELLLQYIDAKFETQKLLMEKLHLETKLDLCMSITDLAATLLPAIRGTEPGVVQL